MSKECEGWQDPEVIRAVANAPPVASTSAVSVPENVTPANIIQPSQKKAKKVPRNPIVGKALEKVEKARRARYEKYGLNDKGVVPLTMSRSGLKDIAKYQKGTKLLIRKLPFQRLVLEICQKDKPCGADKPWQGAV